MFAPFESPAGGHADRYATPAQPRYADAQVADEGERRYAYENGRQRHFAKVPSKHLTSHPLGSTQENYRELAPAGAQRAAASCANCQACMSCVGEDVFCPGCNVAALQPPPGIAPMAR